MTSDARIRRWRRGARARRVAYVAAAAIPLALAAALLAARASERAAFAVGLAALLVAAIASARGWRRIDDAAIARRLDAERGELEDSTALLAKDEAALGPLEALQRRRIDARLAGVAPPSREPVPWRALAAAWIVAVLLAVISFVPWRAAEVSSRDAMARADQAPPSTRITGAMLDIVPPAYTGIAPRRQPELAARVEAGATVRWSLAIDPQPASVALVFHDGASLALARDGEHWRGERAVAKSALYRVEVSGAPEPEGARGHRLELVPDRAPAIRVLEPERTLTPLAAGQSQWTLVFEVSDDYGIGDASLALTHAKGTGENITVSTRRVALRGDSDARARRYRHVVTLAPYALEPGDDVIAKLTVHDNRIPAPQAAESASYILRAPFEESGEASGVEGLVRDTLPAYFRSQRQIILDTEALIAEAAKLAYDALVDRSDSIGVDQRILRLRYGQFLGEQTSVEGEGEHAGEVDAHDAALEPGATTREVLEAFGHTHDDAEAATLLDPETQKLLRAALGKMWQAERHLRTGEPTAALPYEYRALDYIKQVQQATRIYLARVGLELPQLDESRRLTGERAGVHDRTAALAPAAHDDAIAPAWTAMARGETPDLAALRAWVSAREADLPDALAWFDALDRIERDAACVACRARLARLVWSALPPAPSRAVPRTAPDAAARAYLDALGAGE